MTSIPRDFPSPVNQQRFPKIGAPKIPIPAAPRFHLAFSGPSQIVFAEDCVLQYSLPKPSLLGRRPVIMNNCTSSRFIAFFDECGDHTLEKIDKDFPLFVLSTVIVERDAYINEVIPALGRLKLGFWHHEGVNLHSRDIRKALGDFAFMQLPEKRAAFLAAMSEMMDTLPSHSF